jgi:hypothetical protein
MGDNQKGIVAVIGEKQTRFFPALTALLKKHRLSSCVIDCSFGKIISEEDNPGLYQLLKGTSVLDSASSCDFIPTGASSSEGVELIKSIEFEKLLQQMSCRYDYLFLISRTSINSLESEAVLDRCTHAIIVAETPMQDLEPFLDPSRQKEKKHVTFIQVR